MAGTRHLVCIVLLVATPLAGCAQLKTDPKPTAQPGDFVVVDLVRQVQDGNATRLEDVRLVLLGTPPGDPDAYPDGWGPNTTRTAVPGLVDAMDGMEEGETRSTGWLDPAEAYGPRNPGWVDRFDGTAELPRRVNATPTDGEVRVYGRSWDATPRDGGAYLNVTDADVGQTVHHPEFWSEQARMWRSEVTGYNATAIEVRHVVEAGQTVRRGSVEGRVTRVDASAVHVDRNHPLAGERVRFEVTLEEIVFAEPGRSRAPSFELATLDGRRFELTGHRGEPVVLYFFATWCTVCKVQTPEIVRTAEALDGNATLLALSVDPNEQVGTVRDYAERHEGDAELPSLVWAIDDRQSRIGNAYTVISIPKTVVVDDRGFLAWTGQGHVASGEIVDRVEDAVTS